MLPFHTHNVRWSALRLRLCLQYARFLRRIFVYRLNVVVRFPACQNKPLISKASAHGEASSYDWFVVCVPLPSGPSLSRVSSVQNALPSRTTCGYGFILRCTRVIAFFQEISIIGAIYVSVSAMNDKLCTVATGFKSHLTRRTCRCVL